jgi:hypothetical protein
MESVAQSGTEFVFENVMWALIAAAKPYVETALEITRNLSRCASIIIEEVAIYLNTSDTSSDMLFRLTWLEAEKLGKAHHLSKFDRLAGWLMFQAKHNHGARLSEEEYLSIADRIDQSGLRPKDNFEGIARDKIAQNNRDSRKAIHTFRGALVSKDFRRDSKRRLYRASEKWNTACFGTESESC